MRPPSSRSEAGAGAGLFGGVLARGRVAAEVGDASWLRAMLDVEAALALGCARAGVVPEEHARRIAEACRAGQFDATEIGAAAAASGTPVVPLVRALTAAVPGDAAAWVHVGATSQDVLDSAAMLVSRRARAVLLEDLAGAAEAAAALAAAHRDTVMAGRTLLQQALPTTFGLKAAGWMSALDASAEALGGVELPVQLGGAAGTLASLGDAGLDVVREVAAGLELAEPALPWHTDRTRLTGLAGALGTVSAAVGKIARDVVLLAQTEVAEVRVDAPAGQGGSSTLPHKRNPVAAVAASACATQAPGLVATLLTAAAGHEHERAAGSWHAEWRPLVELLRSTGSAVAWICACLEGLEIDPERMRANLDARGDVLLAERVVAALAPALGRLAAHELLEGAVADAVTAGRSLRAVLAGLPQVRERLDDAALADLLDPATYLGSAPALVDRALARHHAARGGGPGGPASPEAS